MSQLYNHGNIIKKSQIKIFNKKCKIFLTNGRKFYIDF